MKKSLYFISLLILLVVVFFGGARFNQRGTNQDAASALDRRILHYVDPMNPEHTTKEPGIAPCGMPMEPVYAEETGGPGGADPARTTTPGTVKINLQKQQSIGVQLGTVTKTKEAHHLRTLGRIIPDENLVYTLIAATDGWLEEINESTTGSLVNENQLLAQIKVYNYDFFTWQQRYLTELGYTSRISVTASSLSPTDQGRRRVSSGAGYQAGLPIPESDIQMLKRQATISRMTTEALSPQGTESLSAPDGTMEHPHTPDQPDSMASSALQENTPPGSRHQTAKTSPATEKLSTPPDDIHSAHMGNQPPSGATSPGADRDRNLLFASKGRQELLNFGVAESQLKTLADNGAYLTHVDLRSPVNGYVLSRLVSPLQRIERGTECFKIADLTRVWVEADIYGSEAKDIQPGMEARITLPNQHEHFTATVSAIMPRFDAVSRSLKIRLEMDNPAYVFRPDMFVDVEFLLPLPESITVPSSAVIDSGKRQTVYVVMGEGVFEPRTVVTGWQTSDRVEIVEGLQPGEQIVISGNFLIDSESRMKLAALRLMEDKTEKPLNTQAPVPTAAPAPQTAPPAVKHDLPKEKTKDPVCGMTINEENALADGLTVEHEGKTYYFCSEDCKEQFKQDPRSFLGEKAADPTQTDASAHGGHSHD
ncbi:MAG: efflux RND transporter periplasmic adaptor subunit [Chlorobium sp.]|nr:efflux RND transporter periplasmic adaptor subunit [Chlorobium sp.]